MTTEQLSAIIEATHVAIKETLTEKGKEYAGANADRLAHFKKAAVLIGGTPEEALFGMLTKHLVSISDMVSDPDQFSNDRWDEKVLDSISYLILLLGLVTEGRPDVWTA